MAMYLSQAVLRLKYNQTRFPFWRFLRVRNLAWDFFGGGGAGAGGLFLVQGFFGVLILGPIILVIPVT